MSIYLIAIIIYMLLMAVLAIYYSKREVKTSKDFILAGQRLPLIVVIGTLTASWVGSGSLVGGAGFVYQYGPLAAIFYFAGGPLGILIMYFIASKTRKLSKNTVPEIIETRFGSLARTLGAVFILLTYISVLSYQFISGGYVLNLTIGLPEHIGSLLTVIVVIFLAVTGGLFSVSYTDFVSSILIILGFLVALPIVLVEVGGISSLATQLPETHLTWTGGLTVIQLIGYFLPLFVYIISDQNMLQRFSAAKDENTARRSSLGFFLGVFILYSLITVLCTVAIVLFQGINPDTALIAVAHQGVPIVIGAVIIASFAALLITTANSWLLSISSNVIYDLYKRFRGDISDEETLKLSRIFVVAVGLFAYFLGTFFDSVLQMSVFAYTLYAASITPVILATFFWKRANTYGAVASILTGGISTIIWEAIGRPMEWNGILISLPLSIIALISFSLATRNKTQRPSNEYNLDIKENV